MVIKSLICSNCDSNDFYTSVNHCVPKGVYLNCRQCGLRTPITVFSENDIEVPVIGSYTLIKFEESYNRDLTDEELKEAYSADQESARRMEMDEN